MDFLAVLQKCEFGDRFRRSLLLVALLLVMFHFFCLAAPLLGVLPKFAGHFENISNTLSNLTVAMVLMYLLVEGQRNLHVSAARRRQRCYASIGEQIKDWFRCCDSPLFRPDVVQPEDAAFEALQNFKVVGESDAVLNCFPQFRADSLPVANYCRKVHFELTNYPNELIYGVHFEFDDGELNRTLCDALKEQLKLDRQSAEFGIDRSIPKRPNWIFLTRTIPLPGGPEASFATNLTHSRHFVELVGHSYEVLYGKAMLELFLSCREQATPCDTAGA